MLIKKSQPARRRRAPQPPPKGQPDGPVPPSRMTVANSIGDAASALGKDAVKLAREGNDFAGLAVRAGLHPLASIAIMAAILPLEYAALKWLEDRSSQQ